MEIFGIFLSRKDAEQGTRSKVLEEKGVIDDSVHGMRKLHAQYPVDHEFGRFWWRGESGAQRLGPTHGWCQLVQSCGERQRLHGICHHAYRCTCWRTQRSKGREEGSWKRRKALSQGLAEQEGEWERAEAVPRHANHYRSDAWAVQAGMEVGGDAQER